MTIVNTKGLHARASGRFVETVESFEADAFVTRNGETVRGDSIMGLLTLGAAQGSEIDVRCEGPQADALLAALSGLIANRFGEND